MVIARNFLLPNVVKNVFNDSSIKIVISDENMSKIVCTGSFVKKRFKNKYLKLGKIMKNVSRRKKENKSYGNSNSNCNSNSNGGVRYIKKILERIVSRINLQDFQKAAFRKSRAKTLERQKPISKVIKKSFLEKDNVLTIDEKIINEVINNK
jgi:hypothetical protein